MLVLGQTLDIRMPKGHYDKSQYKWFNNGKEETRLKICPEGFTYGRLHQIHQLKSYTCEKCLQVVQGKKRRNKEGTLYCKSCNIKNTRHRNQYTSNSFDNKFKTLGLDITYEKYQKLLKQQNERCAICNQYETRKTKSGKIKLLSVDHNHRTGKIRGLLCDDCNLALGKFKDNSTILLNACLYLRSKEE